MLNFVNQYLNSIVLIAGAVALVYFNVKYKGKDKSQEILNNYATLEKQLKEQKDDLQKQLNQQQTAHAAEIGALHKALGEKEALIKMKEEIISNMKETLALRNPDLEGLLTDIRNFMQLLHKEKTSEEIKSQ